MNNERDNNVEDLLRDLEETDFPESDRIRGVPSGSRSPVGGSEEELAPIQPTSTPPTARDRRRSDRPERISSEQLQSFFVSENLLNTIIKYHGGGYDGCIWEWNFGYIDNDGIFHNLMSSGALGVRYESKIYEVLRDSDTEIVHINNEEEMKDFVKNTHATLVYKLAEILYNRFNINVEAECEYCQRIFEISSEEPVIYPTSEGRDFICEECDSLHRCAYCGEFVENVEEITREGYCEYCYDDEVVKPAINSFIDSLENTFDIRLASANIAYDAYDILQFFKEADNPQKVIDSLSQSLNLEFPIEWENKIINLWALVNDKEREYEIPLDLQLEFPFGER